MSATTSVSNKLKAFLIKNSSQSKKKASLLKIESKSKLYLIKKYGPNCSYKYKYSYQVIENLIYNKNSHLVSIFKDKMIADFIDEFLKRFYKKRESFYKIPQFASFYINYQKYFCIPTFRVKFYNKKIHYQREKKAKCFYNEKFKDKESHSFSQNDVGVCPNSMGGKPKGRLYIKNKKKKNNKTFFNKEIKELLEKDTFSINSKNKFNNTISLNESGSKLKSNSSYLLNSTSKEESLCNIMNGFYDKNLFEVNTNDIDNKALSQNNKNINNNILNKKNNNDLKFNNNIKFVLKKRVINIKNKNKNISINNNYEISEYNIKKVDNISTNAIQKIGLANLKIFLNNKEYDKSVNNKKFVRKIGLWKVINEKEKEKENKHVKSQDNNAIKKTNNLLTFHRNKKITRNISYVTLNKKKSLPTSKSNISAKIKKNVFGKDKNTIHKLLKNHNIIDVTKNSNYSKDKIRNMKKKSYKPIRLSKSNININPNDSLLNRIKNKVYDILQKKAHSRDKFQLKNKGDNLEKYQNNINYNSVKRTPNGLTIFYQNLNSNKESNYISNNYRRNNKFDLKSSSNVFKSNKLSKYPSLSEFVRYIRVQKNNPSDSNNKNSQRNYQTIEGKSNNIQNLNININNQINIRLNNINEIPSEPLNNKKYQNQPKLLSRNKNKSIDYNTNQNFVIKYNNNLPTFFEQNNHKNKKFRIFQNKNLFDNNQRGNRNNNKFTYYKEKKIK